MNDFSNIEGIYFLGIGGIGMSALARYFRAGDFIVAGYDRTESPLTLSLQSEGCTITYNDSVSELPPLFADPAKRDKVLVVFTPAIPKESLLLGFFINNGYTVQKRSGVLGLISRGTETVAVAGTHGKTTVSTMTAHLLTSSHVGCSAFLGGISRNYNTNLLIGESRYAVMEADEFDRSFHQLSPLIAVITAIDPDHLDIYGTAEAMHEAYQIFCNKIRTGGALILNENIAGSVRPPSGVKMYTYGFGSDASFRAENISRGDDYYAFDIKTPAGIIKAIRLLMPGMVNVMNATAAAAASFCAGATAEEISQALFLYRGVQRRFDVRLTLPGITYIDDYAHHPEEINALISAVRDFYPGRRVTGIFQPHLYSRTRDFANGFAAALDRLDEVLLLTLYPAREKPIEGVSSDMIASLMKNRNVRVVTKENLLDEVKSVSDGILLTIGAGDIDRFVQPITEVLKKKAR